MPGTRKKKLTAAQATKLATQYLSKEVEGKAAYQLMGELLDQLVDGGMVGVGIPVAGGGTFMLLDQFAGGKTKIFKPTAVSRYKTEVTSDR